MRHTLRLILILFLLPILSAGLAAQNAPPPAKSEGQAHLDQSVQNLADKLADIEKRIDVTRPTSGALSQLSVEIAPLVVDSQALVDRIAPRASALKARLDQFGPKPDKGESKEISDDREAVQKQFAENDGLLKRTKALALKAQQDANAIGKRQRTLFTNSLFQRSTSILSPPLWGTVAKETPTNVADVIRTVRGWFDQYSQGLTGGKLIGFWVMVGIALLLYWPLRFLANRLIRHEATVRAPSQRHKVVIACWKAVSVAGLVIGVMYAVAFVFSFFDTSDPRMMPLFAAIQSGVTRVAIVAGLARGILAPDHPKWRLANLDDSVVRKLLRIVIGVAAIVSIVKIMEALNDVIYASLEFTVATRGIGALLIALSLTAALVGLRTDPEAEDGKAVTPSKSRDLFGLVRGAIWTLVLVITIAVLVGYVAFASFLTEQLTLIGATGAVLYLLIRLSDAVCAYALEPSSRLGRHLIYTVGLRRERLGQLSVLFSGAARLTLMFIAVLVVAAPWGMQSNDVSSNFSAIFFGFKVGDVTISLYGVAIALICFVLVLAATHALQNWLEDRYLPTTKLDSGLRNSIKTSLGYSGFIVALAVAAGNLGVDFQKLAIVAGALSVGIGFGLQSIVNNFVSGLILLWERAVRVGDWVVVGSDQGYVRKINVRSTEIETFDRAAVIVPNSNLVSGVVKNLMRTDRTGRISIDLVVHATADPEKVREVLLDIARSNDDIVSLPAPQVRFTDMTAATMTFSLFCFISDVEGLARVKSDLYFEICKQFRQQKFFDGPAPDPTRINILNLEQLQSLVKSANGRGDGEPARHPRAS